jgi:signal transduction histidine kinase
LTITFAVVAAVTVIISLLLLAAALGQRFENYSDERIEDLAEVAAETLEQRYSLTGGWTATTLEAIPLIATLNGGLGIRVVDEHGTILIDGLLKDASGKSQVTVPSPHAQKPVIVDGRRVGTVYVVAPGEAYLSEEGLRFRIESYQASLIAGVVAIILALVFGMFFSRGLVSPLHHITSVADEIRRGNLSARTDMAGKDEFSQLGRMVDEMLDSLEHNALVERQLTTDLAHELRTPLMGMQATIEAMIDGVLPVNEKQLATLDSEIIRLGRLVEAQLQLSRLEWNRIITAHEEINLTELAFGLMLAYEVLAEENKITVRFEADPDVMVRGDPDLLRQAVTNLFSNAVRYTPAGGSVSIEVRRDEETAQVIVADTGIGISAADADKLFLRFWRADATYDRENSGLGIGLAMVKEIADRHRGWIDVESALGVGSTFILHIPLLAQERGKRHRYRKRPGLSATQAKRAAVEYEGAWEDTREETEGEDHGPRG